MGLDQYLMAQRYVSHWDHSKGTEEYKMADTILELGKPKKLTGQWARPVWSLASTPS